MPPLEECIIMNTHKLSGGCHCGNIRFEVTLTDVPSASHPRICDCDFCRKHGAAYLSDPQGTLRVDVANERDLGKYKQGDGIADFLICRHCGVLPVVSYQENDELYAVVNCKTIDGAQQFGEYAAVSPKLLSGTKKTERWKEKWFRNVIVNVKQRDSM